MLGNIFPLSVNFTYSHAWQGGGNPVLWLLNESITPEARDGGEKAAP